MPAKRQGKKVISVELSDGKAFDTATGDVVPVTELQSHHQYKEYRIVNAKDSNLATGVHINQYKKTSLNYLQSLTDYKDQQMNSVYNQMDICNRIFRWEDVVSTGLDILIDFAVSGFEFTGAKENSKTEKILKDLTKNLNRADYYTHYGLNELIKMMAHEWFVSGNIIPAEAWKLTNYDGSDKARIPTKIELLNPIHIKNDELSFFSGEQRLFFTLAPNSTMADVTNENRVFDLFRDIKSLQESFFRNPLFKGSPIVEDEKMLLKNPLASGVMIELNNARVAHIKRKARHYDAWGIPYLTKAIQAVTYKQKLWQLDINTIEGMINYITIFKIGSPDPKSEYHIVKRKRLTDFSTMLQNPQGATTIIWPHDVEVITAGPSGEVLNFQDKYQEANRAIIQALGVPPILIDGSGRGTASEKTILAMIERLEKVREAISNYISYLLDKIGEMNNMQSEFADVKFEWRPTNLRDEVAIKNLLLAFYDRGLLPRQTTLKEGNYDSKDIIKLKLEEKEKNFDELFVRPDIPFASNPGDQTMKDGRPTTKVDTSDKPNVKATAIDVSEDIILSKFEQDVNIVFAELEEEINKTKKHTKQGMTNKMLVAAVKLEQVASAVAKTTISEASEMIKITEFIKEETEKLRANATDQLVNVIKQRSSPQRSLMLEGTIYQIKKQVIVYAKECYKEFINGTV